MKAILPDNVVGCWTRAHVARLRTFAVIPLFSVVYFLAEVDMTTITITLPDERLRELKETASQLKVSPEELVRVSIEELLTRPAEAFQRAADYVLRKNAELYERLA